MKAGIFDIDGTLLKDKGDVEAVVKPLRSLASMTYYAEDFKTVILTARAEEVREQTVSALKEREVVFDELIMRNNQEMNKPDYLYKKNKIDELRERGFEIDFAVEDRGRVAKMLEQEDITCLKMPEKHRYRHRLFDELRRLYPYTPKPLKKIYVSRYKKKFN